MVSWALAPCTTFAQAGSVSQMEAELGCAVLFGFRSVN